MRKDRVLIGYITFTVMALIGSFLAWGTFVDDGTTFTLTGWSGTLTIYGLKIYNWMVSLSILLMGLALIYKELNIWIPFKASIISVSTLTYIYFAYFFYTLMSRGCICEGYALIFISLTGLNVLYFKNLKTSELPSK